MKNKIKYKFQRAKKGYCDEDLYSIHDWFIDIFPKMLGEFAECTYGYPCNEEKLKQEALKLPANWIEQQIPIIDNIVKEYDCEFDLYDSFCCWLLIILRMKYCFERCDEWHKDYEKMWERGFYEILNNKVEEHKKEACYLFEKWFFDLWW